MIAYTLNGYEFLKNIIRETILVINIYVIKNDFWFYWVFFSNNATTTFANNI